MASTVHNGSITAGQSYIYTNNTNKNVRIVINYLSFGQSGSNPWVYIGTGKTQSGNSSSIALEFVAGQVYGKQLGFVRGDDHVADKAFGPDGFVCPLEFFIPEGSFFEIELPGNHNKKTMYNFVVITED